MMPRQHGARGQLAPSPASSRLVKLLSQLEPTGMLDVYGLERNPFTDRIAEKNRGIVNLATTLRRRELPAGRESYLWFGRRGSGKTTMRMQLEAVHRDAFLISLTDPAALNDHLVSFMRRTGGSEDKWNQHFDRTWRSEDFVDMLVAAAVKGLCARLLAHPRSPAAKGLRGDQTNAVRFLLFLALFGEPTLQVTRREKRRDEERRGETRREEERRGKKRRETRERRETGEERDGRDESGKRAERRERREKRRETRQ